MGQKLSELKNLFGTMEEKKSDTKLPVGNEIYCEEAENDDNGNEPESEHFEGIYNKEREENGNVVDKEGAVGVQSTSYGYIEKKKKTPKKKWVLRFNCARLRNGGNSGAATLSTEPETSRAIANIDVERCVFTRYRRIEEGAGNIVFEPADRRDGSSDSDEEPPEIFNIIKVSKFRVDDDRLDCDERARLVRAREIAEGVDPPPGFRPGQHLQLVEMGFDWAILHPKTFTAQIDNCLPTVHTQVDYIHCLVPDLLQITSSSFYWGKMDRYEAERLLDEKPEGTFLLRDSAQEEFLFSVSFRKYGRSLHARIEQWRHMFSFDSRDPGVFSSSTVCGLIEHYKDPSCCMFFEPSLIIPLHRSFPFPLQHLARAVICSRISYDGISQLKLPKALKVYLKEYHYKQRVKVRSFEAEQ